MNTVIPLTRRQMLTAALPAAAGLAVAGSSLLSQEDAPPVAKPKKPDEVLRRLLQGNERFARGEVKQPRRKPEDFQKVAEGQSPSAVVIGCSDSRVTPELLFDQGIGDLFVVRVAGNVVSGAGPVLKGSIEYAVAELNVPLVMVLGHSQCGAIKAAMKHLDDNDPLPGALNDLIQLIKPAVARVKDKPGNRLENAIKANVEVGCDRLRHLPPVLADRIKAGHLKIVGAVYDLKTGRVNLLD